MDGFEEDMERAGEAVAALANGPAREAAASLEAAFSEAGQSIEASLSQAARTGEVDFAQMAQSILADLASIAAEAALARAGLGGAQTAFTLNFSGGGREKSGALSTKEISKAVAKAAMMGRRFG